MEGGFSPGLENMVNTRKPTGPENEAAVQIDLGKQIVESAKNTRESLGLPEVPGSEKIGPLKSAWGTIYEKAIQARVVGLNHIADRAMANVSAGLGGVRKSEMPKDWREPDTPRVRRSGESPGAWETYASYMLNGRKPQFENDPIKIEELRRETRFDHVLPISKVPESTEQIGEAMINVLLSKDSAPTRIGKNGAPVTEYRLVKDASEVVCIDASKVKDGDEAPKDKVVVIKRSGDESEEELARLSTLLNNNKAVVMVVEDQEVGPYIQMIANHEYLDGVEAASIVTEFANYRTTVNDYFGGDKKLASQEEQMSVAAKVLEATQHGSGANEVKKIIDRTKQDPKKVGALLEKCSHRFNLGKDGENGAVRSFVLEEDKREEISRLYNQLNSKIKSMNIDGLAKGISPAIFLQLYFAESQGTNGKDVRAGVLQYSPDLGLELDLLAMPGTIGELVAAVDNGDKSRVREIADIFSSRKTAGGKRFPNESKIGGLIARALEGVKDPVAKHDLADVTAKLAGTAISGQLMYSVIPEGFVPKTPEISPAAMAGLSESEKAFVRTRNKAVKGWGGPAMARFQFSANTITYSSTNDENGNTIFDGIVVRTKAKWKNGDNK